MKSEKTEREVMNGNMQVGVDYVVTVLLRCSVGGVIVPAEIQHQGSCDCQTATKFST